MNRGYEGKTIFAGKKYKNQFLEYLEDSSQKMKIRLLAYCVMENHYHLVLENASGRMSEFSFSSFQLEIFEEDIFDFGDYFFKISFCISGQIGIRNLTICIVKMVGIGFYIRIVGLVIPPHHCVCGK